MGPLGLFRNRQGVRVCKRFRVASALRALTCFNLLLNYRRASGAEVSGYGGRWDGQSPCKCLELNRCKSSC